MENTGCVGTHGKRKEHIFVAWEPIESKASKTSKACKACIASKTNKASKEGIASVGYTRAS